MPNELKRGCHAAKRGPRAGGSERITRCEIETDSHRRARAVALATWSVDHCAAWPGHDCRRQEAKAAEGGVDGLKGPLTKGTNTSIRLSIRSCASGLSRISSESGLPTV